MQSLLRASRGEKLCVLTFQFRILQEKALFSGYTNFLLRLVQRCFAGYTRLNDSTIHTVPVAWKVKKNVLMYLTLFPSGATIVAHCSSLFQTFIINLTLGLESPEWHHSVAKALLHSIQFLFCLVCNGARLQEFYKTN